MPETTYPTFRFYGNLYRVLPDGTAQRQVKKTGQWEKGSRDPQKYNADFQAAYLTATVEG